MKTSNSKRQFLKLGLLSVGTFGMFGCDESTTPDENSSSDSDDSNSAPSSSDTSNGDASNTSTESASRDLSLIHI